MLVGIVEVSGVFPARFEEQKDENKEIQTQHDQLLMLIAITVRNVIGSRTRQFAEISFNS